jgi:hypothetical protein
MKTIYNFLILFILSVSFFNSYGQQLNFTFYGTNLNLNEGQAYNRLLIERDKNSGTYQQIGNYKVLGTQYVFSKNGDIFGKNGKISISIRFNTYSQQVEIFQKKTNNFIILDNQDVDSFYLYSDDKLANQQKIRFINSTYIDNTQKYFYNIIEEGKNYMLYKVYKSTLEEVPTNPSFREFELEYDYFYKKNPNNKLMKIKTRYSSVYKIFKNDTDISALFSTTEFNTGPESAIKKVIAKLNQ